MPDYRLYCLSEAGKITRAEEFRASDDADALMIARGMKKRVQCELWERGRLVATIPPKL